ncbi:hypothetical protein ACFRCG_39665 [Embleya sp. NPDC056575]|uniref:hypothetical protein n=1 Tax=unclassified Embleya TaxID=2699296 RepID=UPI00368E9520
MAASLRSLLGRVIPAGRGPRTPAPATGGVHVITTAPPPPHPRVLAELAYVADDTRWRPYREADDDLYIDLGPWSGHHPGRHRRTP